jgi:hypothetical protein
VTTTLQIIIENIKGLLESTKDAKIRNAKEIKEELAKHEAIKAYEHKKKRALIIDLGHYKIPSLD